VPKCGTHRVRMRDSPSAPPVPWQAADNLIDEPEE
jgi:hypothetical protein